MTLLSGIGGMAAVLLIAAIAKWRVAIPDERCREGRVSEPAQGADAAGARGHLPVAAGELLLADVGIGACLGRESEDQRLAGPRRSSCCLASRPKGFWFEPKEVRDLIDDENTRANRIEAMRWGFLFAMVTAIAVYILDHVRYRDRRRSDPHRHVVRHCCGAAPLRLPRAARPPRWLSGWPTSLKDRRTELGLTQAELAERVGVTRKTVNTVENGVFTPSATLAIKLAEALELSVEQLFWIER